MPVEWPFAEDIVQLGGTRAKRIASEYGERQQATARSILADLAYQPGVILADEVGMGKTYVALGVVASVLLATKDSGRPVIVMMPPGLASKWPREWQQFKSLCCVRPDALSWVRACYARTPTDFFRLLDDPRHHRPHLIWMTTGCFSLGLSDPWIKLALIRIARSNTKLDDGAKQRLYKWAATLVRLKSNRRLTPDIVERLLHAELSRWHQILVREEILSEDVDDPVPVHLLQHQHELDWSTLTAVLRGEVIPGRKGSVSSRRLKEARWDFNEACQDVYWQWLARVRWRASLLVLDEAHHAKNDNTRLANLFRSDDTNRLMVGDSEDAPLLRNKFDRMLFMTATPFQLGHHELIRVLRSFAAVKWNGPSSPDSTREEYFTAMSELEKRLDENRLAGRRLDRLWGRLSKETVATGSNDENLIGSVTGWWRQVKTGPRKPFEQEILHAVEKCQQTKTRAESDPDRPWCALRTWVIRHNRPITLPDEGHAPPISRRVLRYGRAILEDEKDQRQVDGGLPIAANGALPFLLAARAQGELAYGSAKARAFFAEGLCSSYEAFHHTREQRGDVRDVDDDGIEGKGAVGPRTTRIHSIVPVSWYEKQIDTLIPSRAAPEAERYKHPKVQAVIDRVTQLWLEGEKVLVFCFYRETAKALRAHAGRQIENVIQKLAAEKLGLESKRSVIEAREWLNRIARRLSDEKSPFYREILRFLREPFDDAEFKPLRDRSDELVKLLASYVRTPSFIARYLPIEVPEVRKALGEGQTNKRIIRVGVSVLSQALTERADASDMTMRQRVVEFLRFAKDLAEMGQRHAMVAEEECSDDQLTEYLKAVAVYVSPRRHEDDDDEEARSQASGEGTYRALPTVRMVYGDTGREVRERLMLAFNSPLFPEILISSAVLAEGVDLHRFCRHVIHHDLCWNPSTLEQRTGRLDRIRCKAEITRQPIVIYEPFIAGSADEKMFRVVRDRERWFQIVMGQKFEFSEAETEKLANRLSLPEELARELVFDLTRAPVYVNTVVGRNS